ncbi:MAG: hypothetical protein ACI815_000711 [Psychroserpens sp.]|jgi:hypothetical protein
MGNLLKISLQNHFLVVFLHTFFTESQEEKVQKEKFINNIFCSNCLALGWLPNTN